LHQTGRYEVLAGYISPVNDAYGKQDLALGIDRVKMCELAVEHGASNWISVDGWESMQPVHLPTARVMERFDRCLNKVGGVSVNTSTGKFNQYINKVNK
jgi:nicotinamide mononucleotide adenylyltransferase